VENTPSQMLGQWQRLLASLSLKQKISIGVAAAAVIAGLIGFSRWRQEGDFKPLYNSMQADDAGAVLEKLKESGVEYRLTENGSTILVPSARLAELRLQLAGAGLPKTGRIGFELFDKTNFGATEFTEHINYRRALEGELERSIKSVGEVEQARVHLTFPKESVFLEAQTPAKASVLLKLRPSARLTPQNVVAITHLVSSAVEGLTPEAVSVLDMRGNLLSRPARAADMAELSEGALEYRQRIERDLLTKINTTLEPLLGPERFRAAVSVECDFTSGEQSEETYDPEKSVMTSSQKLEETTTSGSSGGVPGVGSNLPRPVPRAPNSAAGVTRRSESINYQTSKTVRRIKLPQGGIKRISASILLDQDVRWEGNGPKRQKVLVPKSPESLKSIRELVSGVVGFTPDRGDQLIVESLPFETTVQVTDAPSVPPAQAPARPAPFAVPLYVWAGAGGAVLLIVIALIARKLLSRGKSKKIATTVPQLEGSANGAAAERAQAPALPSAADVKRQLEEQAENRAKAVEEAHRALTVPSAAPTKAEALREFLRENAKKDPVTAANILRTWLQENPSS
jgi:flagellar M-ring protein FliF